MRAIVDAKAFSEALKQVEKLPQKSGIPALGESWPVFRTAAAP